MEADPKKKNKREEGERSELWREKVTERMSSMGQIVKQKKKGRPSKADLARRAAEAEIERRRSLRRRNVKYNIDYDDYLDDEEEFVEEEEEEEEEEELRRREKKLRLLMKVNQMSESVGSRGRTAARGEHARLVSEDDSELKPVKKGITDGCSGAEDCDEDDEHVNEEKEERGRKLDSKGCESLPGTPCGLASGVPLPEKKKLELILDKLQKKDIYGVYAEPVDPEELPDYHDVIEHPMDFTTVRKKLGNGSYATLEQFESDIFLICSNAMQYNSAETIYHKQARSIEELARKKFHKLRIEFERSEKEMKSEQKPGSNSFVRKQMRKPVCRTSQEPAVGSDFTSGAALATATADLQNSFMATQSGACERLGNADRLVENNSPMDHTYPEKTEELSSGKGVSKLGKKSFLLDENPRATYNIANEVRSESVLTTFEGEVKQLVAVGLHAEYSYARSLARFAATIGPVAWKVASQRIEKALPDGCKFGRGWVGEYEPLPTPVLMAENRIQNECTRLHSSAGLRKDSEALKTSLSPRPTPTPDRKPSLFAPTTPNISTRHQQNPLPKHLLDPQNKASRQVELNSPSSVNRNNVELVSGRQLPNGSEITTSRGAETVTRNMNASRPAPFKQSNSNGVVTRGLPNGKVMNTGLNPRIASPSPDTAPNQMGRTTATYFPRGNEQGLTDPVQVMRVLTEKSQMQHKREDASPTSQSVPSVKREESTNTDSPNAASVAARAWMSLGAAGFKHPAENCSTRKDQISADSLYNPTREVHSQFPRVRAEFPPNGMQFRPEKSGFPVPALVQQQIQMGNGQFQNRPMIFPQFASADLSRFQVPSPWRGLSPRAQPSPKQDTFPPDLNIGFQSPGSPGRQSSGVMVDSQQPDLALQL